MPSVEVVISVLFCGLFEVPGLGNWDPELGVGDGPVLGAWVVFKTATSENFVLVLESDVVFLNLVWCPKYLEVLG